MALTHTSHARDGGRRAPGTAGRTTVCRIRRNTYSGCECGTRIERRAAGLGALPFDADSDPIHSLISHARTPHQVSTGDGWAHYIARPLLGNIYPNLVLSDPGLDAINATAGRRAGSSYGETPTWAHPGISRPVRSASNMARMCTDVPQIWLGYGSDVARMSLGCASDVAQIWLGWGSDLPRMWLGCGSDVARMWLGWGSDVARM
jgi:hypothetical protein